MEREARGLHRPQPSKAWPGIYPHAKRASGPVVPTSYNGRRPFPPGSTRCLLYSNCSTPIARSPNKNRRYSCRCSTHRVSSSDKKIRPGPLASRGGGRRAPGTGAIPGNVGRPPAGAGRIRHRAVGPPVENDLPGFTVGPPFAWYPACSGPIRKVVRPREGKREEAEPLP